MSIASATLSSAFGDTGAQSDIARTLVPLLDALGWRGDDSFLFAAMPHMPSEMGVVELLNTMANLKFESRVQDARLDMVDRRQMPCLFIPEGGSAKVLLAKANDQVLAFDGAAGEYVQDSIKPTPGQAIFFRPMSRDADSFLKQQPNWFRKVLGRFSQLFMHTVILTGILTILALLTPIFIMTLYDQVLAAGSMRTLTYLGVGIVLYVLADAGFRYLRAYLFNFTSVRLGNIIGNEVLRRILYLPPSYTETANMGAQVARIRDFESVREFVAGPAAASLIELPFLLILVAGLFVIGGPVAWVPVASMVLFALFGLAVLPFMRSANADAAKMGSERQSFILEMLANLREIKNIGATDTWLERFRTLSADAAWSTYTTAQLTAFVNTFSHTLVMLSGLLTMAVGVGLVMNGTMTSGALMASMVLTWRILAPLRSGFSVLAQTGRIKRSIDQIDRLMNIRLENKQESTLLRTLTLDGRVVFTNVAIRYSQDAPPALIGINFTANPGEVVVIVGHDGAGKTTILKLILGLYHPQAGQILLDHTNVRQLDPVGVRHAIGYAPQSNHFFYGTIAQNMRLSSPRASDEDVQQAAWKAQVLDDILALPEGFETRIGDHNVSKLSTSFRKRLNLARVFLRKSNLYLFDEPETGMTEWEVDNFVAALQMDKGNVTTFIATHNPRFMDLADKVIWMEKGRMRMMGTPDEVRDVFLKENE